MKSPPALATWLLRITIPESYRALVLSDLADEYRSRTHAARFWYWRQSVRSAIAMSVMELRQSEWQWPLLAVLSGCTLPTLLLDEAWSHVLSQIPLKIGLERGPDFLALQLVVTAIAAFCAGPACARRGTFLWLPIAWISTAFAHAATRGICPNWYHAAAIACVTAGFIRAAKQRRST
jgi:hypothetical protein